MNTQTVDGIEFTRINNDVNGNPRYVCHFLNLCKETDTPAEVVNNDGSRMSAWDVCKYIYNETPTARQYRKALERAHQIGGRKYHTKQYGGGIVFQSYSLPELTEAIRKVLAK